MKYYLQMAKSSYAIKNGKSPDTEIGPFKLLEATPFDLCYSDGKVYFIAVRGTDPTDYSDLEADLRIAGNALRSSERFKQDLDTLLSWQQKYPGDWYGVGHSLGGAICDEFLLMGLIKEAFTFNAAVQPENLKAGVQNYRLYSHGDPLYALFGQHTDSTKLAGKDETIAEQVSNILEHHKLSNFDWFETI
jgi:hypothetical protein